MATNFVRHKIYKQAVNPLCHLCGKHNETIPHIASGCVMLRSTKYVERHNKVYKYLHLCVLQNEGRSVVPNWKQHKAEETPFICLGTGRTLMYDMTQKVDHAVSANYPDIVILDEEKKTALLINVTCPMDINM
eukprot:11392041-Ditylum_brightwellii.AAC.1